MNPNFEVIGRQFATGYYKAFDANRGNLSSYYIGKSMLSFEGGRFQGPTAISEKFKSLPFIRVQHVLTSIDSQPTSDNGVTVLVVGKLKTDDDPPHTFAESFTLIPSDVKADSYVILNQMFRLSLHHN